MVRNLPEIFPSQSNYIRLLVAVRCLSNTENAQSSHKNLSKFGHLLHVQFPGQLFSSFRSCTIGITKYGCLRFQEMDISLSGAALLHRWTMKLYRQNQVRKQLTSPGLVVMGDSSCSRGHGFKSRRHILDGHDIFHIDLLKKIVLLF